MLVTMFQTATALALLEGCDAVDHMPLFAFDTQYFVVVAAAHSKALEACLQLP